MRAAVLGSPITHSLSPTLHRTAYAELGLAWRYEAIDCGEQDLEAFIGGLDDSWAGLSLTMPLKRAVLPLLDVVSPLATAVGGVNTVVFADGGRRGDNTDVGGMADALRAAEIERPRHAVVLGGGATAASSLAALRELGTDDVTVVVRNPARTAELREAAGRLGVTARVATFADVGERTGRTWDLLLSTLPTGAADAVAHLAGRAGSVFDVCYEPWPTPLASAARSAGVPVVGGFELLLRQAARQVTLMTGIAEVPLEAMRGAGERVLDDRAEEHRAV